MTIEEIDSMNQIQKRKEYLELRIAVLIGEFNRISPIKVESIDVRNQLFLTDDNLKVKTLKEVIIKLEDM